VWCRLAPGTCALPTASPRATGVESGRPEWWASQPTPPGAMRLGLYRKTPREALHRRLPVKAPGGDDTLFAQPTRSALVEVVDAWVTLSMLAHRRDVADVLLCNQTLLKEHPVAASIPDLPVAGPDPSRWAWDSAAQAAGPSWISRAATRRGRRVGLGWQCSRATPPTGSGALGFCDRRDQAQGLDRYRHPHLLRLTVFTPRHGHPCSSRRIVLWEPSAATRTPPHATHHVALIGVRGAFHRGVSMLSRHLALAESSEPPRPSEHRRAAASDMLFTRMRCAPGAVRSCGPDAPHASQRLLSIERATSTPRAPATLA
jgi:hypothetical protein